MREGDLETRDGAIIDLQGVSPSSKDLLIWGEAVDVDILKSLPKLEGIEIYRTRERDLPKVARIGELRLNHLSLRFWHQPDLGEFRPPAGLTALAVWQSNKLVSLDGIAPSSPTSSHP